MKTLSVLAAALIAFGVTFSAYAKNIDNSYIITFKDPAGKEAPLITPPTMDRQKAGFKKVPFGQHSTGQNKDALAKELDLDGEVVSIFESINSIHVNITPKEAYRLSLDERVLSVEPNQIISTGIQNNPGWGLDRLDETTPILDNTYTDTPWTGAGRAIYVFDSGLTLTNPFVALEFGSRASVFWDVNGGNGNDCNGHGTMVAAVAASNTYGVAKGATVVMVKVTYGCTGDSDVATHVTAFNWLTQNAPAGTIVNWSHWLQSTSNSLETAIQAAHNAGIIVVACAGNDSGDTANFSPVRQSHAFVVGATTQSRITSFGEDEKWSGSRIGSQVDAFAPGHQVRTINQVGGQTSVSGTSLAAPYIAGIFATGCQSSGTYCDTTPVATIFQDLKNAGILGTVVNTGGGALPAGTTPRFIYKW